MTPFPSLQSVVIPEINHRVVSQPDFLVFITNSTPGFSPVVKGSSRDIQLCLGLSRFHPPGEARLSSASSPPGSGPATPCPKLSWCPASVLASAEELPLLLFCVRTPVSWVRWPLLSWVTPFEGPHSLEVSEKRVIEGKCFEFLRVWKRPCSNFSPDKVFHCL